MEYCKKCVHTVGGTGQDEGNSIILTQDGGYFIAGFTASNNGDVTSNHGLYDCWVVKLNSAGLIQWQKSLGGSALEYATSVKLTSDGGYILTGITGSNNGDVTGNHGGADYWVVKLDSLGSILWQKCLGGNLDEWAYSIDLTNDGGYVVAGWTQSNNGDVTGNHGIMDYWVVKLDSLGSIVWQKCLGGNDEERAHSIVSTNDGGYLIAGYTVSNNGDVSGNHGFSSDAWVVKLDSAGSLLWQKCLGGTQDDRAYSIALTNDGGYVIGCYTRSNDGDVSGNPGGINDLNDWVVKLNSAGTIVWQKCFGGLGLENINSIVSTVDGGFIFTGYTTSKDSTISDNHGATDYRVVKIDSAGIMQWQKSFGGTKIDDPKSVLQTSGGGYIVVGRSFSENGDVNGLHFPNYPDIWVVKLTDKFNLIKGKAFLDLNSNSFQDIGEPPTQYKKITETITNRFAFTQFNSSYNVSVLDSGNFYVTIEPINYFNAFPVSHSATFTGIQQTDSLNDFAFQPMGAFNDLCVTLTPLGAYRPGFNASYMINYENVGTTSLNGTVKIFPDNVLSYVSSTQTPVSVNIDSVEWNVGTLAPFQSGSFKVIFSLSSSALLGSNLITQCVIEPVANDANAACNFSTSSVIVGSSYDPNDILVSEDTLTTTQLATQPYLDYIIRFQNTGNDTAFTVKIINPIDTNKLSLSTIEFVNASHPVQLKWLNYSNNMEFLFENILLPDSNINEPLSHGFVHYKIKPKTTLLAGDSVTNKAYIYFDFNAPVETNTAVTRIVLVTGSPTLILPEREGIALYPNPAKDEITISLKNGKVNQPMSVKIYDVLGKEILMQQSKTANTKLQTSKLSKGIYFVEVVSGKEVYRSKVVKE